MVDSTAAELTRQADRLFSKKLVLDSLWQRIADELYPERADFTRTILDGNEFAENLFDSTPPRNRRELAYAIGSLMRPPAKKWFKMKVRDESIMVSDLGRDWLSWATDQKRSIIYAGKSRWQPSLQEGDNDLIAFGNAVHSLTEGPQRDRSIIYETHHLRDCAWQEDRSRTVNWMARKFKLSLRNWETTFPGVAMDDSHRRILEKDPFHELDMLHVALPSAQYDVSSKKARKHPFWSVYICRETQRIVRQGGYFEFPYFVRRWALRHGSPYGYSPAAMLGLIDARVLQAQSRVILDAGELSVRPPMIARDEAIDGLQIYAGAVNYANLDPDMKTSEALVPVNLGENLPIGLDMRIDTREMLAAAFFLNKLTLPSDKDMTAYEVGERISEYIRSIGPVVEPFEADNAGILDATFALGLRLGRFGDIESIPRELVGVDLGYEFDTPVQIAYARQKAMRGKEIVTSVAEAVQATGRTEILDNFDFDAISRDSARALDAEPGWIVPKEIVEAQRQQRAAAQQQMVDQQQTSATLDNLGKMAELVPAAANANQAIPALLDGVPYEDVTGEQGGYPEEIGWPEAPEGMDDGPAPSIPMLMDDAGAGALQPGPAAPAPLPIARQPVNPPSITPPTPVEAAPVTQDAVPAKGGDTDMKALLRDLVATLKTEQRVVKGKDGSFTIKRG